jgi:hypothetical protein
MTIPWKGRSLDCREKARMRVAPPTPKKPTESQTLALSQSELSAHVGVQQEAEAVAATTRAIPDNKKQSATVERLRVKQEIAEERDGDAYAPPVFDLTSKQKPEVFEVEAEPYRERTPEYEARERAPFVIGQEEPLEAGGASAYPPIPHGCLA